MFTYLFTISLPFVSALRFVTATAGQLIPPLFSSFFCVCNLLSYFPLLCEHLDNTMSLYFKKPDFSKAAPWKTFVSSMPKPDQIDENLRKCQNKVRQASWKRLGLGVPNTPSYHNQLA